MDDLKAIKILQPTDIISGTQVLFSIQLNDNIGSVKQIVYSMYALQKGDTNPTWHPLSTVNIAGSPQSEKSIFSITFDSTQFASPQYVHLKVQWQRMRIF
jgi:hypothetical protein